MLGPGCRGVDLMWEVPTVSGQEGSATATVYVNLISQDLDRLFPDPEDADKRGHGVQGWSMGFVAEGLNVDSHFTENTAADLNPDWGGFGFSGGEGPTPITPFPSLFFSAKIVDPATSPSQSHGIVLAFVNCLNGCDPMLEYGELPADGAESLIGITVSPIEKPTFGAAVGGSLRVQDQLSSGDATAVPTDAIVTVSGNSFVACNRDFITLNLEFVVLAEPTFIRCDANGDGRMNIGDIVWVINDLVRHRVPNTNMNQTINMCREALNCNGEDGTTDPLADVVYGINYLFLGGPPPPGPFPACAQADGDCAVQRCAL